MSYDLPDPLPPGNGITFNELAELLALITERDYITAQYILALAMLELQPNNPTILESLKTLGITVLIFNKD